MCVLSYPNSEVDGAGDQQGQGQGGNPSREAHKPSSSEIKALEKVSLGVASFSGHKALFSSIIRKSQVSWFVDFKEKAELLHRLYLGLLSSAPN